MAGWHHRLDGDEFEQTLGDGEGQGSLVCCSPWGRKELDTTEQLNTNIDEAAPPNSVHDEMRVSMFMAAVSGGECLETLQVPTTGEGWCHILQLLKKNNNK